MFFFNKNLTTRLFEWPGSKQLAIPTSSQDAKQQEPHLLLVGMQNGTLIIWKTNLQFLVKLNTILPYYQVTVHLDIYPTDFKTCVHIKPSQRYYGRFIPNYPGSNQDILQ